MAFKLDFDKLRDPVWQAEQKAKRDAENAEREAKDAELRKALNVCLDNYESLAENERSFIGSCRHKVNTFGVLSEKQERWLFDIAKRGNQPETRDDIRD